MQSSPAPAAAPPIGGTVTVDVGDFAEQLIAAATVYAKKMAAAGVPIALSEIPMGALLKEFITPQVVDGYLDQAATVAEAFVHGATFTVSPNDALTAIGAKLFKAGQPLLTEFWNADVAPLFAKASAAVAKL